jgi:hypothetical protein
MAHIPSKETSPETDHHEKRTEDDAREDRKKKRGRRHIQYDNRSNGCQQPNITAIRYRLSRLRVQYRLALISLSSPVYRG